MNSPTRQQLPGVVFVDNYDSFVFNLVDEFRSRHCPVTVLRNSTAPGQVLERLDAMGRLALLVLSPGPGTPRDAGCLIEVVKRRPRRVPVFGVCLGHQAIIEALGGETVAAGEIVHGKSSVVEIDERGILFDGLGDSLSVARYHSLVGVPPAGRLNVTATLGPMVMAVESRADNVAAVQFHPESILTRSGGQIIDNVVRWAAQEDRAPIGSETR